MQGQGQFKPPGVNGHVEPKGGPEPVQGAANFFMGCFMAGLGVLFAAGIVLYLLVRHSAPQWPPPGAPDLPQTLWLSTGLIVLSSATIQFALAAIRRDNVIGLRSGLGFTLVLAVVFMASQLKGWLDMGLGQVDALEAHVRQFVAVFVFLTVLHAVHVVGGVVPLIVCTLRAGRNAYSAHDHQGVTNLVRYWHFLGTVWLILFAVLELTRSK
jgi:cytochrome c oxidase subunit 3